MLQQKITNKLKNVIRFKKSDMISNIQSYMRDNDLYISSDFNIAHEVVEIVGDIDVDYEPQYKILDIDENKCICTFEIDCDINFSVKIKGFDGNSASYDEDDIHYTNTVNINANVQRKLPVFIKAYYCRDVNDQLYVDNYQLGIKPITIECTDYDEDYYRQK